MGLALLLTAFASAVLATERTSAPNGCIEVSSGGRFSTIQAAVNSLSATSTADQCIFIHPGTYSEQVLVGSRSAKLTIYGYTTDTNSYSQNQVSITSKLSQSNGLSNDETGTLRVKAANFKLYNVNVINGYGKGSQAIALSAYADSGYYGCSFIGYQDTLLANQGNQLYSNCQIQGATDFIFGQHASAWFENCDIRVLAASTGYVTANGRDSATDPSYYVFNNCDIAAAPRQSVSAGAYFLGRPWRDYARVVFQRTTMSAVINGAGWHPWNDEGRTGNVMFGEYGNSGPGSQGKRASFSTKLSSPVSISTILGSNYASKGFFDASYM